MTTQLLPSSGANNERVNKMVWAITNLPQRKNGARLLDAYVEREGEEIFKAACNRIRFTYWKNAAQVDRATGETLKPISREEYFTGQGPQSMASEMIEMYRP